MNEDMGIMERKVNSLRDILRILILTLLFSGFAAGIVQAANPQVLGVGGNSWVGNSTMDNATEDNGDHNIKIGIFADNFDDGDLSGWTIDSGIWTNESGRIKVADENSNTIRSIYSNLTVPSSIVIHLDVEYENESNARRFPQVRWGFQNITNYSAAYHGFNASNIEIGKINLNYISTDIWTVNNMGYTTPSMNYFILINESNYVDYYVNGILRADDIDLGTDYLSGGKISLAGTVESDTYFDNLRVASVINGLEKTTGNITAWYDAGSGNETYQIDVNTTTPVNTNYTIWYSENGTDSFTQLGGVSIGNNSVVLSPGYQNTDVRIILNGNETVTPELISIAFYTQSVSGGTNGTNLASISPLTSTVYAGETATYIMSLQNNGTLTDNYTIIVDNPNSATTAETNISNV
ncbi:MAG: hypothetical protein OIN87_07175, partial [Candidatus Methanoperedens sp.]|nr:hypothetical protein [Candidatus Methanoperedens sp.]